MAPIRLLIVDDHAILRDGIKALLQTAPDMQVVGEAASGEAAIPLVERLRPDVVLMDIAMPGLGGLETTPAICRHTRVLMLTQYDDQEYLVRALKAGARGFVVKKALAGELLQAIRAVAAGKTYLDPSIASDVVAGYLATRSRDVVTDPYDTLTDREKQVLKLLAEGRTSKEIATALDISVKTAMAHRDNLMRKLDLHHRAALVRFAITKGVI